MLTDPIGKANWSVFGDMTLYNGEIKILTRYTWLPDTMDPRGPKGK
jgi:hypothetical protein